MLKWKITNANTNERLVLLQDRILPNNIQIRINSTFPQRYRRLLAQQATDYGVMLRRSISVLVSYINKLRWES